MEKPYESELRRRTDFYKDLEKCKKRIINGYIQSNLKKMYDLLGGVSYGSTRALDRFALTTAHHFRGSALYAYRGMSDAASVNTLRKVEKLMKRGDIRKAKEVLLELMVKQGATVS